MDHWHCFRLALLAFLSLGTGFADYSSGYCPKLDPSSVNCTNGANCGIVFPPPHKNCTASGLLTCSGLGCCGDECMEPRSQPSPTPKSGRCPSTSPRTRQVLGALSPGTCWDDVDCQGSKKCCVYGRQNLCTDPVLPSGSYCPRLDPSALNCAQPDVCGFFPPPSPPSPVNCSSGQIACSNLTCCEDICTSPRPQPSPPPKPGKCPGTEALALVDPNPNNPRTCFDDVDCRDAMKCCVYGKFFSFCMTPL